MNSEQLRLFIAGAFGSETEANKIQALLNPYLRAALEELRQIIEMLPDESLARQKAWREMLPEIEKAMGPYNDAFLSLLERELPIDGERAAVETAEQLKSVGVPVASVETVKVQAMGDSAKIFLNTKIADKRIVEMFTPRGDKPSPFTAANRKAINQIVTGGIITGDSTENIAKKVNAELPSLLRRQSRALARTAIQDYNRQVKESVWDANRDALQGLKYEWVAALDSRTCPVCAPLDGSVKDDKKDFPKTPVHVNCRCLVVLIDPDDKGRVRYGQEALREQPTGDGAYKTKKKVKGERLFRKTRKVETVNDQSPRYADFLNTAGETTQQMFFGGGKAGTKRAKKFKRLIQNGSSPQDALVRVIKGE